MANNRTHTYMNNATPGTSPGAANTETVVLNLGKITNEFPNPQVMLMAYVEYTPGAAATAVTIRVRRDSLTGVLVGTAAVHGGDVVAGKLSGLNLSTMDMRPGDFAGDYVVTVQGTGEGGAGVVGQVSIMAEVT